jgi:signal transduction histidine kinase
VPAAEAGKELRVASDGSALVWADPTDLAHVVDNLIENSLRYCPPGAAIDVNASVDDGRGVLSVGDDGPGIPPEDREHVFDRFYRGQNGRRLAPGTGLGLAIVAELVRRWDGDVRLLHGPGTRIEAEFPRRPTDS